MWRYAPDAPITAPDTITAITGALIPTVRGGYRGPYSYGELWYEATTVQSGYNGSALCVNDAGGARLFLAANTAIYELTSTGTRTDRSKGGGYTTGTFFTFAQLGNTTVAGNKTDALQSSTTGAFADTAGSPPKARIVLSDANQIVLLNYNDGTDTPDGWWCSDVGTTATWTPASGNEAKNGRLRDAGGAITAGCNSPFGGVIAFKKNAMYVGTYVGQPYVRRWRKVSDRVGCGWIEGCVNTGEKVYFASSQDVYEFDGSQIRSITEGIRKHLRENVLHAIYQRVVLQWDQTNSLLYLWYGPTAAGGGGLLNGCYVYNTVTGNWGYASGYAAWGATLNGSTDTTAVPVGFLSVTADEVKAVFTDLSPIADQAVNASHWAFFSNNNAAIKVVSFGCFSGESLPSYADISPAAVTWTTSYQGDTRNMVTLQGITPDVVTTDNAAVTYARFSISVTGKQFTAYGPTCSSASATMSSKYKFDLLAQGHFLSATYSIDLTSATSNIPEWFGHTPEYVKAGRA